MRWHVRSVVEDPNGSLASLLAPYWGDEVRYVEDHHEVGDAPVMRLRGIGRSIRVVACDREPTASPRGPVWLPAPGSGRSRQVEVADPWEPEPPDDDPRGSFDGWIIEVDVERLW